MVALFALWTHARAARAEAANSPSLGDTFAALPGIHRVGVADSGTPHFTLAAALGYAWTEPQPGDAGGHQRFPAQLAGAWASHRDLALALKIGGRYDLHPRDRLGTVDDGWLFDQSLWLRFGRMVHRQLRLGAQLGVFFPGAENLGRSLSSPALDLVGLAAYSSLDQRFTLAGLVGFRYDQTGAAGRSAAQLRSGDRLALELSGYNALLVGIGQAYRIDRSELLAELSADLLLGSAELTQSPLRAALGARYHASPSLALEVLSESSLSSRPAIEAGSPLIPIEPRTALWLGIRYRFMPAAAPPPLPPSTVVESPALPREALVRVSVLNEAQVGVAGATLSLRTNGRTIYAKEQGSGHYEIPRVPVGKAVVSVSAVGYKPEERAIDVDARAAPLVLKLDAAIVPGQIRGLVRAFNGRGLSAGVRIEPLGIEVQTDAQGYFSVDVAPGDYEVVIRSPHYAEQRRTVKIVKEGVVILNVDLRSSP